MNFIAYLRDYPPNIVTGAFLTTHEYFRALVQAGHQVHVVCSTRESAFGQHEGVKFYGSRRSSRLPRCQALIHHHGDVNRDHAVRYAQRHRLPRILFVHGRTHKRRRLDSPALAVFDSPLIERFYSAYTGDRLVIPPPVNPDLYRTTPGDRVTLVGLSRAKGVDVLLELARRTPDIQFLGVRKHPIGRKRGPLPAGLIELERLANVTVIPPTFNMRDVYSRTRILLMPSSQEEYGRVGIEAAISGIPTVASDIGGIRWAMGDSAVFVARDDIDGWQRAIETLRDDTEWAAWSERAEAHAAVLDYDQDLKMFVAAAEGVANERR